jgi:gas vesicle protein GvpA/GvpJ/GvpM family
VSMEGRRVFQQPATSVIDILDRVLDKGLVVAGDISISLANVELLTIRIRLLVCSIDKAEQIGLNWWRYDRNLVAPAVAAAASQQVAALEQHLGRAARKTTTKRTSARKS